VPPPPFAIGGRTQETLDNPRVRVRTLVREEFPQFLRRGRQAGEIKRHTAQQRPAVGWRQRFGTGRSHAFEDETIDGRLIPVPRGDSGDTRDTGNLGEFGVFSDVGEFGKFRQRGTGEWRIGPQLSR
jgi:hypothetical protein